MAPSLAASARTTLEVAAGVLGITVTDDGRTASPAAPGGSGIAGMRAQALGGTLAAAPDPSGGFTVVASLPMTPSSAAAPGSGSTSGSTSPSGSASASASASASVEETS